MHLNLFSVSDLIMFEMWSVAYVLKSSDHDLHVSIDSILPFHKLI